MRAYIGPTMDTMLEIPYVSALEPVMSRPVKISTTSTGRAIGFVAPRQPRQWTIGLTRANEAIWGALQELDITNKGPHLWSTPWASAVNLLTPMGSLVGDTSTPVALEDGISFSATTLTGVTPIGAEIFIPKKQSFTVSVYGFTDRTVYIDWYRIPPLGSGVTATKGGSGFAQRPQVGTALIRRWQTVAADPTYDRRVTISLGAGTWARAQVSLGSALLPWGMGDGCASAVVTESPTGAAAAIFNQRAEYPRTRDMSFTVTEIGVPA